MQILCFDIEIEGRHFFEGNYNNHFLSLCFPSRQSVRWSVSSGGSDKTNHSVSLIICVFRIQLDLTIGSSEAYKPSKYMEITQSSEN